MKKNFNPSFLSLILIAIVGLAVLLIWPKSVEDLPCPDLDFKQPKSLIPLPSNPEFDYADIFSNDLNNDGHFDFVITSLPSKDRSKRTPLTLVLSDKEGSYRIQSITGESKFYHARHVSFADFDGDGFKDILVADHGPDIAPFPGAKSGWVQNLNGKNFKGHLLQTEDVFNFHISPVSLDDQLMIFQSNINGADTLSSRLYSLPDEAHPALKDLSDLIPEIAKKQCFMTSHTTDLFGDKNDEILIGACDTSSVETSTPKDFILSWNGKAYVVNQELPPRPKGPTWGTVSFTHGDFNKDGRVDIVRITHDLGFKLGQIQILLQRPDRSFQPTPESFKQDPKVEGFIPWAYPYGEFLFFNFLTMKFPEDVNPDFLERNFLFAVQDGALRNYSQCLPQEIQTKYGRIFTGGDKVYLFEPGQISLIPQTPVMAD